VSAGQEVNEDGKALRDEIARGLHDRYCTGGRGLPPNEGDRAEADAVMPIVQRIIAERDRARSIAVALEGECSVRDEALAEIAALRVTVLRSERTIEKETGGISWDLLGIANDIRRVLASLQRRLDPFRDDEGEAQQ
jgi:hypothetical protein